MAFKTAIGYENDAHPAAEMLAAANQIGASYVRIIANTGSDRAVIADRMRQAKAAGKKIILTIGDAPGGAHRNPTPGAALKLIAGLPQADQYTYTNEPDQTGRRAKQYANDWRTVRKVVGSRLLLGDISPTGVGWLANVEKELRHRQAGRPVDVALHPYSFNPNWGGSLANIRGARRTLERAGGSKVNWWFTEYGRQPSQQGQLGMDLQRARDARARALVLYDVQSPSGWSTALSDRSRALMLAASANR